YEHTNLAIAAVGSAHHGVVTEHHAEQQGISAAALRRRAAAGLLTHVDQGIFVIPGSPSTWAQRCVLACAAAGPTSIISHRCAASVWQLDGFESAPLELTVARHTTRDRRPNVIVHESTDLATIDRTTRNHVEVTSAIRTIIDLAAVASPYRLEQALEDALRRKLFTLEQIAHRFAAISRRGKRGMLKLRPLLEERVGENVPTASELERRIARIIKGLPLPPPVRQYRVELADGPVFLDFAWPDRMLLVEGDGMYDHATNLRLPWDEGRQNQLVLLGWHPVRFCWVMVVRHREVVEHELMAAFDRFPVIGPG
ncbi:MAG: hypothetical protein ACXV8G_14325, partial [Acidimicrobiales bacterium]